MLCILTKKSTLTIDIIINIYILIIYLLCQYIFMTMSLADYEWNNLSSENLPEVKNLEEQIVQAAREVFNGLENLVTIEDLWKIWDILTRMLRTKYIPLLILLLFVATKAEGQSGNYLWWWISTLYWDNIKQADHKPNWFDLSYMHYRQPDNSNIAFNMWLRYQHLAKEEAPNVRYSTNLTWWFIWADLVFGSVSSRNDYFSRWNISTALGIELGWYLRSTTSESPTSWWEVKESKFHPVTWLNLKFRIRWRHLSWMLSPYVTLHRDDETDWRKIWDDLDYQAWVRLYIGLRE